MILDKLLNIFKPKEKPNIELKEKATIEPKEKTTIEIDDFPKLNEMDDTIDNGNRQWAQIYVIQDILVENELTTYDEFNDRVAAKISAIDQDLAGREEKE